MSDIRSDPWSELGTRLANERADKAEADNARLRAALETLVNAQALAGVREQVAGWNGENRPQPYNERHPSRLGATLPKTTCGAVYALDEAMTAARAALGVSPQGEGG